MVALIAVLLVAPPKEGQNRPMRHAPPLLRPKAKSTTIPRAPPNIRVGLIGEKADEPAKGKRGVPK